MDNKISQEICDSSSRKICLRGGAGLNGIVKCVELIIGKCPYSSVRAQYQREIEEWYKKLKTGSFINTLAKGDKE